MGLGKEMWIAEKEEYCQQYIDEEITTAEFIDAMADFCFDKNEAMDLAQELQKER